MANNTSVNNLTNMCVSAKEALIGDKLNDLIDALVADTQYQGEQLTAEQVEKLNTMCAGANKAQLGTWLDNALRAAAGQATIQPLTPEAEKALNNICVTCQRVVYTEEGLEVKGLGSLLAWCASKTVDKGNQILTFTVPGEDGETIIDQSAGTITLAIKSPAVKSSLIATFTTSRDATVKVGNVKQVSGTTQNNFSQPVSYVVTSEAGESRTYVVTVIQKYEVTTQAEGATVSIVDQAGTTIETGDFVVEGTQLTITATAGEGATTVELKVNNETVESPYSMTVSSDVSVSAVGA